VDALVFVCLGLLYCYVFFSPGFYSVFLTSQEKMSLQDAS